MSRFLNSRLQALAPYTPGEQPQMQNLIKLNTNELPYPPPPAVVQAATAQAQRLNLYNDPEATALTQALAQEFGVVPACVFTGNGSDEVLAFCFQGLSERGVAFADLTYGFYPVFAQLYGCDATVVPLEKDLSLNLSRYNGMQKTIYLANPNAPTALAVPRATIETFLQQNPDALLIVDEAYVKFGGESCVPLTQKYQNVVVVGTFSKAYAMAGARLGYAVASPELIADLNRLKYSLNPYNVNSMTQAAGVAALAERAYFTGCVQKVCTTRDNFVASVRAIGFECAASQTNFVLCRHPGFAGQALFAGLRQSGIVVRWFNNPRIENYLRITIGTEEEMQQVLAALRSLTTQ